jgi:putative thioredoxin
MPIDVTEASFEVDVIEASAKLPVVVDFWAEWCGPCRTLGPVLEKAEASRQGEIVLAKVDTDRNPNLALRFQTASIPAVKAFRDGEVVSEFLGAQPPARVEAFFDALLPKPADEGLERARELHAEGKDEEALELLADITGSFEADGLAARIELSRDAEPPLAEALRKLDAGEREAGVEALIALLEANGHEHSESIRRAVVGTLTELGQGSPEAREYRRRLAASLY